MWCELVSVYPAKNKYMAKLTQPNVNMSFIQTFCSSYIYIPIYVYIQQSSCTNVFYSNLQMYPKK